MKTYRIRKFQNGKSRDGKPYINYSLTIPSPIAERLPADMDFACELTKDGILFKPAAEVEEVVELPAWAKSGNGNGLMGDKQTLSERRDGTTRKRPGRK